MTSPYPGIDFFDVDHTIIDASSGLQFLLTGIRLGVFPIRFLFSLPSVILRYGQGEIEQSSSHHQLNALRGYSKSDIDRVCDVTFRKRIQPRIFPEAHAIIKRKLESGRLVVFLTSSFTPIIEPLANELGVKKIIANEFEFIDGNSEGLRNKRFVFGAEKKVRAFEMMQQLGISPNDCSFYSDSRHDLALLESIGNPACVNPSGKLKRIALSRGWKILRFVR